MNPAFIGFLKAIGVVLLVSGLSFLGDVTHYTNLLNPYTASVLAALAASLESYIKEHTDKAFFGAISVKH